MPRVGSQFFPRILVEVRYHIFQDREKVSDLHPNLPLPLNYWQAQLLQQLYFYFPFGPCILGDPESSCDPCQLVHLTFLCPPCPPIQQLFYLLQLSMHLWVCVLTVLSHVWVPVVRNSCSFESHSTGPVNSLCHCQQVSWRWELYLGAQS